MLSGDSSDQELVLAASRGSQVAFQFLYHRHHLKVYRFARAMTFRSDLADEITQEVFFILIRGLSRFDAGRGELRHYLLGIARHETLRVLRRERLYVELEDAPSVPVTLPDAMPGFEQIRHAIDSLPPAYREVVLLCEMEEMDYKDVARMLDCPVGTVRSRLHRARALLLEKCQARKVRAKV